MVSDPSESGQQLYSIGDCPVCIDSGAVLLLRRTDSGTWVFFCPLCGVAWNEAPVDGRLDQIASLEDQAPNGVVLPTDVEVLRAGLRVTEVPLDTWLPYLTEWLDNRTSP